jgi:hypothetical protein
MPFNVFWMRTSDKNDKWRRHVVAINFKLTRNWLDHFNS